MRVSPRRNERKGEETGENRMKMRERERERITTDDVFHNTCDSKQFEEPILSPYFHPRYSTTRIETKHGILIDRYPIVAKLTKRQKKIAKHSSLNGMNSSVGARNKVSRKKKDGIGMRVGIRGKNGRAADEWKGSREKERFI